MFKIMKPLNYKKIVSVITAVCFAFSIFSASGFAAPAQIEAPALQTVNASAALNPSNFVVPFNIGRVTDSVNFKSDKVIVQIQDLHAHEETQRNIASILSILDSKYKINKVYVEGAAGGVDTSWLAGISNESLKSSITNSLLAEGVLTGSELFSVNSGKTNILKGIEDKKTYLDNFKRLITIDSQRDEIKSLFPEIRMILSSLADRHYGKENKKIDSVVNRYKNGKLSFNKYFSFLVKKAKKQNVYFGFYPSVSLLADIIKVQNGLNKNKINSQTADFLKELQAEIAFSQYKELMEYSSKPETEGVFYFKLAEFYNNGSYGGKYPELAEFLQFINLNQTINPINLVNEERALLWEIKNKAAATSVEKELIYLSSFADLLEGFLENKITAPEYRYFERELPGFKVLWTKYTRMASLPALERYYSLFESFYKVNVERNGIFVKEISGSLPKANEANIKFSADMVMTDSAGLLSRAKEIEVVVSGGFHTQDVSRILQNARQSYVVITPNVTSGAELADKLFAEDVIRISKYIPENAFQKALQSARFELTDGSVKSAVGIFFQKAVLDAFKAEAEKQLRDSGVDPSGVSAAELSESIIESIESSSLKAEIDKKTTEDFTIKEITFNKDGSYLATVEVSGAETVYLLSGSGISDASADTGEAEKRQNVIREIARNIAEIIKNSVSNIGEFFGLAGNFTESVLNFLTAYDNYKALSNTSDEIRVRQELVNAISEMEDEVKKAEKSGDRDRISERVRQQLETAKEQIGWTPDSSLLTADSTKQAFSRLFGDWFANTIVGKFIASVIFAPFYERRQLMEVFELYGRSDNPGINDEESADLRRQADEALINFLIDHEKYRTSGEAGRGAYRSAASNIFRASGRAYTAVLRVTKIKALADFAANIANVAVHAASNFAGITRSGAVLASDVAAAPDERQISALLASMKLSAGVEKTFREIIEILIELNDTNALDIIFNKANAEDRTAILSDLAQLNDRRSLKEYVETFKALAASSKEGVNPTTGKTVEPVNPGSVKQISGFEDPLHQRYTEKGAEHADELAVVLVAGGVGDRLRYKVRNENGEFVDGIKIGIEPNIIDQQSYLENVIGEMNNYALQQGKGAHPILTIMTSDSTHDMTVKFITEKLNYKYKEVEVSPGVKRIELTNDANPTNKIYIMTQKNVPGVLGADGRLAISERKDEAGRYFLETKPHGHGDVHELMYKTGVAEELQKAGKSKLMFIQDTNGAVMNTALSMTGMMFEEGKKLAVATVAIKPGVDAVGSLVEVTDPATGKKEIFNLEYNYVKEMIKSGAIKEENIQDYINGNVNIFAVDISAYRGILDRTEGKVGEFTNPKVDPKNPGAYTSTARIETEMQRLYTEFYEDEIGIMNYRDTSFIFTTAKNGIRDKNGNLIETEQKETLPASEEDINENYRKILRAAGVEASSEGEIIFLGQQYKRGSQIKLKNWGQTLKWLKSRYSGTNAISGRSAVRLNGDVGFSGLVVDGAVNVVADKGVSVRLNGVIKNAGYKTVMYDDDSEKAKELSELKQYDIISQYSVRGYYAEKLQELDIRITRPGNYEVSVAGNRVSVRDTDTGNTAVFDSLNVEIDAKTVFTPETAAQALVSETAEHPAVLDAAQTPDEASADLILPDSKNFIVRMLIKLAALLGINLNSTYISKNASELVGKEDVIILGEYSNEQSLFDNAAKKAALGKNVNIIMPYGAAAAQTQDLESGNTGSRYIYKRTIAQENGYSVNVWYYRAEVSESAAAAAYDALNYVLSGLPGNAGIVENASDISFNDITVAAPLAAVFKTTSDAVEDARAKDEGYVNFTNGMSEENKIEILADKQREDSEGDNMRNQLPLITDIDVSKIKDEGLIDAFLATVFSVDLTFAAFNDNTAPLKEFIRAVHSKDKRVILNFKPANKAEAEDIIAMIENRGLKALRTDWIGVDGITFDLDSLSEADFNSLKSRLGKLLPVIKRENSAAMMSVKSAFYGEAGNNIMPGIDDYNKYINISGNYNENTVDVEEIAASAKKAIESGAKALIIDYEVSELLHTRGINVDIYSLFLGIVAAWTSVVRKSPESIYRNARRSGYKENIAITPDQENRLYEALRELNAGNVSAAQTVSDILQTSKANVLDKSKTDEARGYAQGILERVLVNRFGDKKFSYKTNADVYRTALVMAKMNSMSDSDITKYLDGKIDPETLQELYNRYSIVDVSFNETVAAAQEGINFVISELESADNTAQKQDPQAIADLLIMLGISKTTDVEIERVNFDDQRAGIAAILSAA